jgi:hypothetical protein
LITGYGTGDCGISFKQGDEALVFVNQYSADWYDVSLCSRTQLLSDASADLTALGSPKIKLNHRSTIFHFIKPHLSFSATIIGLSVILSGYIGFRKWLKKNPK